MKPLPYNKEAELGLLATILADHRTHDEIFSKLKAENFYLDANREVFQKAYTLYKSGQDIDAVVIEGREMYCLEILNNYIHRISQYEIYIEEILEDFKKRSIFNLGVSLQQLARNGKPSQEIIPFIQDYVEGLERENKIEVKSVDELIEKFGSQEAYEALTHSCMSTDFTDLDKMVLFRPGDLIIIAGRPSMGKTAFSLSLSKNLAKNHIPIGFFSMEMKNQYLLNRLAKSEGYQYTGFEGYKEGLKKLRGIPFYFCDMPGQSIETLNLYISHFVRKYDVKAVFIDYLTLMDLPEAQNRNLEISEATRRIKLIAEKYGIVIFLLSQLSRNVEHRSDRKPALADLRESGAIEQDADVVLLLYRPEKYGIKKDKEGNDLTNYLECIVAKNRDGRTGVVKLFYDEKLHFINNWESKYNLVSK